MGHCVHVHVHVHVRVHAHVHNWMQYTKHAKTSKKCTIDHKIFVVKIFSSTTFSDEN